MTGYNYETIIGNISIIEKDNKIVYIGPKKEGLIINETKLVKLCFNQIEEYFMGKRKTFDIELEITGTSFQKKVYHELLNIPYGQTKSYKDIAIAIGNRKASRAVGMACNKNPIVLIIPCHRVIGSNKKLVGFGMGLNIKEVLLNIEK